MSFSILGKRPKLIEKMAEDINSLLKINASGPYIN